VLATLSGMKDRSRLTEAQHTESAPYARTSGDEEHTLPPPLAFVVQFRPEAALERGHYIGRVEHVVSGRAAAFHTLNDLLDFLTGVLATVRKQSSAES
jgi:hypothetical protein